MLDKYPCKACVMSVDIYPEGKYGNIRVAAGNKAHAEEIAMVTGHPYQEDVPYEMCFPKNMNFEDYCYRSAVLKQQLHSYVELYEMGLWLEMFLLPLDSDDENKGYCLYSYNVAPKSNASVMTDVSQDIASTVLASCVKLHEAKDFNECLNEVLRDVRNVCEARRCCILLVDEEARESKVLADSLRPEYTALRTAESMNKGFYSTVESWKSTLAGSTGLIVKNEQDMEEIKKRNPVWYESLAKNSVKTLVLYPLKYDNKLVGYIWATNFNTDNALKIKGVLELVSYFIASRIANYQLVNRLEVMSSIDLLTGTKNRNAMNNRVSEFDAPTFIMPNSLGVIFADLNGLKQINDVKGHAAGDRLLKKCAAMLQQVFVDEDIYRAGGDEFMIICTDCSEETLEDKVKELRKICDADQDVSFAVGWYFEKGKIDIRKCMSVADERMYEDKEEYYKKYPEKRYR